MDYKTIIEKKKSVRDYSDKEIKNDIARELKAYANNCKKLVDDINIDIRFMDNDDVYQQLDGFAGYNGILINAPHYMIVLSENKEYYIENAGYIGEEICLKAFDLGVDSCWITFKDSKTIIEKLNIVTDKEVVAIIALGYAKKASKSIFSTAKAGQNPTKADIKIKDGKSTRLPIDELVFIEEWGKSAKIEQLQELGLLDSLSCATLAPSTLNRQPWRFIVDKNLIVLAVRDDENTNTYEERIDSGIVMLYFEAVMGQTLYNLKWNFENIENKYNIPDNYLIVASCNF